MYDKSSATACRKLRTNAAVASLPLQLRHAARQQGAASPAANPLLQPASKRRKQASPKASAVGVAAASAASPAVSQGAAAAAAAADEPDPRLCLWEPPVSPFGLLGEWGKRFLVCNGAGWPV